MVVRISNSWTSCRRLFLVIRFSKSTPGMQALERMHKRRAFKPCLCRHSRESRADCLHLGFVFHIVSLFSLKLHQSTPLSSLHLVSVVSAFTTGLENRERTGSGVSEAADHLCTLEAVSPLVRVQCNE